MAKAVERRVAVRRKAKAQKEALRPSKAKRSGAAATERVDKVRGVLLSDAAVARALAGYVHKSPVTVRRLMRRWGKLILKVPIPGKAGRVPTKRMLSDAKRDVLLFYDAEEALGERSAVVKAFYMASHERELRFDWAKARQRVQDASLDFWDKVHNWDECLAMSSGPNNNSCNIYVCGTRPVTQQALTSLVCHEGLHNLAKRVRAGNPFLAEEREHVAMALIGDPQLTR